MPRNQALGCRLARRFVTVHAATGEESGRLWRRWPEVDNGLDAVVALRPRETAVMVLESRPTV